VSGNPGGILAYAWDFNGDSVVDSTQPNPLHTYTTCGNYTVSLTVVDAVGPVTVIKVNYVITDLIVPSFTSQLIGVNTVQFTDTSSPVPQTWAWDLDGDGLTDSTQQNPTFTYPSSCSEVNVRLTATLACQPAVVLQKRIAVATTFETTFAGGLVTTATATGGTNFVDVDVTNPFGITVCGMHVHSNVANGSPLTVNVHQKTGSYVGSVDNAALWRLVGSGAVTSRGPGRTFVAFNPPIHLAFGQNALGIEHVGASPLYTNLGALQTFTTPDFTLTTGMVQAAPIFGPVATSAQFSPRVWNGALQFGTTQSNGAAGYGYIGAGCTGSLGVPGNRSTTVPVVGGAATIVVDRLPFDIGVMALGVSNTVSGLGPLPVDLTFLGMPGCPLRVSFEATLTLFGAGNAATLVFPVPLSVSLVGTQIYTQALSLDPALNAFGFALSDAAVLLVGQ
jgi:PKD domain